MSSREGITDLGGSRLLLTPCHISGSCRNFDNLTIFYQVWTSLDILGKDKQQTGAELSIWNMELTRPVMAGVEMDYKLQNKQFYQTFGAVTKFQGSLKT